MEDAVSKYVRLIERFTSGAIDARTFETTYLDMFKSESAPLPDLAFNVLDRLFADVDAYCADENLRGESDLDEQALRHESLHALRELTAVADKR